MIGRCEFVVSGVVAATAGQFHLLGRCGDVAFQLGDQFDQIEYESESSHAVCLRIVRIEAYHQLLDKLVPGMSARLHVTGEGVERLRPKAVLMVSRNLTGDRTNAASATVNQE